MSDLNNAAKKAREWTAKRDALIRAANANGLSLRAIANEVGLSHTQVANIVRSAPRTPEGTTDE